MRYAVIMHKFSPVERVLATWVIGVFVSVTLAFGALFALNRLVYTPTGQVQEYFRALQDGNGSHALGILGARVPEGDGSLLDGEVLKKSVSGLSNITYEVVESSDDGEHATVRASYTLAGAQEHTDFRLRHVGDHWGLFPRWEIEPGELPELKVSIKGVQAATVNTRKVAVDDGEATFPVLYPGNYSISYDSTVYTAQPYSQKVLSADANSQVKLDLKASDQARESVQHQVEDYVNSCTEQKTLYPSGCPFEYTFPGRVDGEVTWSVTEYPHPHVTVTANGEWNADQAQGKIKVSFTQLDLYTGERQPFEKEVPFTIKPTVNVNNGTAVHVSF